MELVSGCNFPVAVQTHGPAVVRGLPPVIRAPIVGLVPATLLRLMPLRLRALLRLHLGAVPTRVVPLTRRALRLPFSLRSLLTRRGPVVVVAGLCGSEFLRSRLAPLRLSGVAPLTIRPGRTVGAHPR